MVKGRWVQAEGELLVKLWCILDPDDLLALLRGTLCQFASQLRHSRAAAPSPCRMRDDAAQATIAKASEVQSLSHEFSSAAHLVQQVRGDSDIRRRDPAACHSTGPATA